MLTCFLYIETGLLNIDALHHFQVLDSIFGNISRKLTMVIVWYTSSGHLKLYAIFSYSFYIDKSYKTDVLLVRIRGFRF